jgi:hypothetical protein
MGGQPGLTVDHSLLEPRQLLAFQTTDGHSVPLCYLAPGAVSAKGAGLLSIIRIKHEAYGYLVPGLSVRNQSETQ